MTFRVKVHLDAGSYHVVDGADMALEEANAFLRAVALRGLSNLTVRSYAFDLVALYRWMQASGRSLAGLGQPDLLEFVAYERERGAQPASINRRLTTCRLLHRFWHPEDLGAKVGTSLPSPHYRSPGRDRRIGMHVLKKKRDLVLRVKVPQKQVTPLSTEQVCEFLRGLRHYRDQAIVHLMLLCGLRSHEILGLERRDVSLTERRVKVFGKGGKDRIVPLADLAAMATEQYLKHERPRKCADEALFVCLQGKRRGHVMTPPGLRSLFRGRRKTSSLSTANPHRFRHTFGADMARAGVNLPVLQKLMGHTNPEMTLRYINLSLSDIAEAYRAASAEIERRYSVDD